MAIIFTGDLSNQEQVEVLIARTIADAQDVSILITRTGIQRRHPAHKFPMGDWDEVLQVNLKALWTLCRDSGAYKRTRTQINWPATAAAKDGFAQLTKALSNEWTSQAVNVNVIAPGYVAPGIKI